MLEDVGAFGEVALLDGGKKAIIKRILGIKVFVIIEFSR
jgi:hypothetical protein